MLACGALSLYAQNLSLSPDPVITLGNNPGTFEIIGYASLTNTGDQAVSINWSRSYDQGPGEWTSLVCDENACYNETVSESPQIVTLEANGGTSNLDVHLRPNNSAGCGSFTLFVLTEDLSDTLLAGVYCFEMGVDLGCNCNEIVTNTDDLELSLSNFYLFPNPVQSTFSIQGDEKVAAVRIYNLLGAQIKYFEQGPGAVYQVDDLTPGMYLVEALDADGRAIQTLRMQKQ